MLEHVAAALVVCAAGIEGLASVTLRVSDAGAARRHYGEHLGLALETAGADLVARVNPGQTLVLRPGLRADEDIRLADFTLAVQDPRALRRALAEWKPSPVQGGAFTVRDPDGNLVRFAAITPGAAAAGTAVSRHLEHLGVLVERKNLAAAERFYGAALGLTEVWRHAPVKLSLIKYRIPGPRADILELMIHDGGLTRQRRGSMSHVNLAVTDIHATHRTLLARGAKAPTPRVNAEQIWAMNLFDADGTRTEIQDTTKIPPAAITEETLHGRAAWVLSNGWMRVALLRGGGHIAEVRLLAGDTVNPMRVPHYPTIDPPTYDPAKHDAIYGTDPHRWLSSGYMGHLLCFPWYGPASSPEEIAAGLGNHGEAPIVEWKEAKRSVTQDAAVFEYGAELPKSHYRVARRVTLPRGLKQATVEEWVENLLDQDRPMQWMQHATFGPPFIEPGKSVMRISAVRAEPASPDVTQRTMPAAAHSGSYTALLLDATRRQQFFTMRHAERPLTIGYVFPTEGNLWVGDWQENQRNQHKPWNGQVVARGIEFGSSPFAEGLRKAIERGKLFDVPAYRWIGARQRLKTEYTIFLATGDPQDAALEHGVVVLKP